MISSKRAASIILEPDQGKRDQIVDKLTESDAKYLLKVALAAMKGQEWEAVEK